MVLYVPYCHTSILNGVLITYETVDSILSEKKAWSNYCMHIVIPVFFKEKYVGEKKKEKYVDMFLKSKTERK